MIKVNDKKSLNSSDNFLCDSETNPAQATIAVATQLNSGNTTGSSFPSFREAPNKMGLLLFNLDEAKSAIRQQVETQLGKQLSLPELIDPLVNYLLEVVQEDPAQRELFGFAR